MKLFKIVLLTCFMAAVTCSAAFAGSGKAIVPRWHAGKGAKYIQRTYFYISNITQNDLEVKITLYNGDGTIYTSAVYSNFQNNNTEIGAGKSATFYAENPYADDKSYGGYAVIEWKNKGTDDNAVGLVAHATWAQHNSAPTMYGIPINDGRPF